MDRSGVAWRGVEWNVVGWSAVEWSIVEWSGVGRSGVSTFLVVYEANGNISDTIIVGLTKLYNFLYACLRSA